MLSTMKDDKSVDWSKTTMAYVNHRAVPNEDETATHLKAKRLFLDEWEKEGLKVLTLSGSTDAMVEADKYANSLRVLPENVLPRDKQTGFPMFDLMLIGVGLDGHIGSLYPDREEVMDKDKWVLPVVKSSSSSITLSLPLIKSSRKIVVASAGKSEKYPLGKAEAMVRALEKNETPSTFPASALRNCATWIMDDGAAELLSKKV
mmetsp:Transcript_50985/g.159311  ORF Transcript_50985/g.159311 Transcript_50985/m.159311 type:complete len:204 (-) Transcript_50985:140-751(-)